MVDYSKLRPGNITSPQFSHLLYLIFWPFYGLAFLLMERFIPLDYHPIHVPLDERIPFCEAFIIPYHLWFFLIVGTLLYLALFDPRLFVRYMRFIILTYTVCIIVFALYPSCQNLRPAQMPRDNILTRMISGLYAFDTNTNVLPSIHVVGSFASWFACKDAPHFKTKWAKLVLMLVVLVISFSTVFIKQHSIVDVIAGILLSLIAYPIVRLAEKQRKKEA